MDGNPKKPEDATPGSRPTPPCGVVDWGRVGYAQADARQQELLRKRKAGEISDLLILCEHPPVITLGRNATRENVLASDEMLAARGVELRPSNRGGDVTFHGPGQLVGYPILDLRDWKTDVAAYLRALEEVLLRTAANFGIRAHRLDPPESERRPGEIRARRKFYTGIWTAAPDGNDAKLAAIGVHLSRWVTSHGFAINVTTDLSYFDLIVPCGIADKSVTSLERLLGEPRTAAEQMEAVKQAVAGNFGAVFGRAMHPVSQTTWEEWLGAQQAAAS